MDNHRSNARGNTPRRIPTAACRAIDPKPHATLNVERDLHPVHAYPVDLHPVDLHRTDLHRTALELLAATVCEAAVIAVVADSSGKPVIGISVNHAPSDDVCAVAELLVTAGIELDRGDATYQVVLGVVRTQPSTALPRETTALAVSQQELADWTNAVRRLAVARFSVADLVVVDGQRWASVRALLGPASH